MSKKVRVRFAPSPTGPLHIGGVRTALYNYLFAKKNGGDFILRIEDTDQTRFVEGAEQYIIDSLNWCGVKFDEGQGIGGEFGPYKQSERREIYKKYIKGLIDSGNAYYAFDTAEKLNELRANAEKNGESFMYSQHNRESLNNSLALSAEETQAKIEAGEAFVVRFKMPVDRLVEFTDIVRGTVKVNSSTLDDKILFKSDGLPTYHMANVVDDYEMKISHVIRGEEWLPSCPLHILLYEAFGWKDNTPEFAHLPLLLKPTGKGKLSKRDGDKLGFPVFPMRWIDPKTQDVSAGYKEDGYFPEAFINMLAFLGWNPGTEDELLSLKELEEQFTLDRVGKSGARFSKDKAVWFNNQYLQRKSTEELTPLFEALLTEKGIKFEGKDLQEIVSLVKERANFVEDLYEQAQFFFEQPSEYDAKTVKKFWKGNIVEILTDVKNIFNAEEDFNATNLKEKFSAYMNEKELGFGKVMNPLRLSLVGSNKGPDLFQLIEILGKEETANRIEKAIAEL
jgi:glutamyl-tRNA synthetase